MRFFPRWFRRDKISIPPPRLDPAANHPRGEDVDMHALPGGPHLPPDVAGGHIMQPPPGLHPQKSDMPVDPPIGGGGLGLGHTSPVPIPLGSQSGEKEDLYALPTPVVAKGGGQGPRFLGPPVHIPNPADSLPKDRDLHMPEPMHGHPDPKPINPGVGFGPRPKDPPHEAMNHQHDQHWWATHGGANPNTPQAPWDPLTPGPKPSSNPWPYPEHPKTADVGEDGPPHVVPSAVGHHQEPMVATAPPQPIESATGFGPNEVKTGGGYGPKGILGGGGMTDPFAKKHKDHLPENPLGSLGGDPREGSGKV